MIDSCASVCLRTYKFTMHCTTPSFYIDPMAPPPKSKDAQDAPRLCEELVHRSDVILVDVV